MNIECFRPFESASYPCYWLGPNFEFHMNESAQSSVPPLSDEQAMVRLLRMALQEQSQRSENSAFTLPLLTDALSIRTLTLLPVDGGLLACAVEEKITPIDAFSQQMREPLTGIFATLPLLASRLEDHDLQLAEEIQTKSYELLRLTNNLENGSRTEKKLYELQTINLADFAQTLCYCADSVCKESHTSITCNILEESLPIKAEPRLLSDVLLNLIRNSLQYTRDGNHITITLQQSGNQALLTVEDLGMGIKPDHLDRVFEPYFSIDPYGDSSERPSLGLGLSVVRSTVLGFGGSVNIESTFGEGTRVYIALPLSTENSEMLNSDVASYLLNRYSPVYIQLSGCCRRPQR